MLYSLLIYLDPTNVPDDFDPQEMRQKWMAYTQEMRDAGAFQAGEGLELPDTATTVRVRNGDVLSTDGPFAETKEILGGFYVIDVPNLDEALSWASRTPNASSGSVEVRPVLNVV